MSRYIFVLFQAFINEEVFAVITGKLGDMLKLVCNVKKSPFYHKNVCEIKPKEKIV